MSRSKDYTVENIPGVEEFSNRRHPVPVVPPRVPHPKTLCGPNRSCLSDSEQHRHSRHKFLTSRRDIRNCMQRPTTYSHSDAEASNVDKYPDLSKSNTSNKYSTIKHLLLRNNQSESQVARVRPFESTNISNYNKSSNSNGSIRSRNDKAGMSLRLTSSSSAEPLKNFTSSDKNPSKCHSLKNQKTEDKLLIKQINGHVPQTSNPPLKVTNTQLAKSSKNNSIVKAEDLDNNISSISTICDKFPVQDTRKRIFKTEQSSKVIVTSKKKFFEAKSFKFLMKIPGLSHFNDKRSKVKIPEYSNETLTNSLSFVRTVRITKSSEGETDGKNNGNETEQKTGSLIRVYQKTTTIVAPVEPVNPSNELNNETNNDSFKRIPKPPDPRSYKLPSRQGLQVGSNNLQRPRDKPPSIPANLNDCGLPDGCNQVEDPEYSTPEYLREQIISPARRPSTPSKSSVPPQAIQLPVVAIHINKSRYLESGRVHKLATIDESADSCKTEDKRIGTSAFICEERLEMPELPEPWDYIQSRISEDINSLQRRADIEHQASNFSQATKSSCSSPRRRVEQMLDPGGFRQALITHPPSPPPSLLRRLGTKEISGLGKVKVVLRVSGDGRDEESLLQVDTKKRQVTLAEQQETKPSPQDRRPAVAAPKMFAFDALFTPNEPQSEVCSSALTDLIHAVINGVDSCLFSFGQQTNRKMETMIGSSESASNMGAIPCAISWLYRCISEQKQKTGMKFSIRVSALEVAAPSWQSKDLLAQHAECSEGSAYMSLGQVELRAPSVEQAAYYLDSALASRSQQHSHFFYTLHLYQYSVAGKGAVSGGRSRLHLIDLGSCGKTPGGLPLSGIGNILLAIFNGQKHFPHKDHKLTQQLRDCLGSLTCHAAMVAHVSPLASNYTDTLTTLQFASRVHRMRRRKFKFLGNSCIVAGEDSNRLTGSSDFDPSSSEQSADTVIYLGPSEETDGEHPPVYIPSLNSGDNRGSLGKVLKGSILDQKSKIVSKSVPGSPQKTLAEVTKKNNSAKGGASSARSSPVRLVKPSPGSREERWVDGPRVSRNRGRESHGPETWVDGPKTHSDSPKLHFDSPKHYESLKNHDPLKNHFDPTKNHLESPKNHEPPKNHHGGPYGFMDQHKKNMIRQWVENQCAHISGKPRHSKPEQNHQLPAVLHPLNRVQAEVPLEQLQCSGPKSPDVVDEMEVEIIEVEEPVEPVPMQDSCLQVTEEDIALCMGELENPLPEVDQEEHPLRILSQENLTIVSTFTGNSTDSLTATHELERLFPPNHKIFNKPNLWQEDDTNDIISSKLGSQYESLTRLHEMYENRLRRTVEAKVSRSHSLMLSNILQDSSDFDTNSIASEPAYLPGENKNGVKIQKDLSSHALFKTNPNNLYQNVKSISNGMEDAQEDEEEAVVPPPLTSDHLLTLSRHSIGFDNGKTKGGEDSKNMRNGVHDPGGPLEYWRREEWSWSENYMKLSRDMSSSNRSYLAAYGHTGHSMFDQRNPVHHTTNP